MVWFDTPPRRPRARSRPFQSLARPNNPTRLVPCASRSLYFSPSVSAHAFVRSVLSRRAISAVTAVTAAVNTTTTTPPPLTPLPPLPPLPLQRELVDAKSEMAQLLYDRELQNIFMRKRDRILITILSRSLSSGDRERVTQMLKTTGHEVCGVPVL